MFHLKAPWGRGINVCMYDKKKKFEIFFKHFETTWYIIEWKLDDMIFS